MATYIFSAITAAQALAVGPGDTVTFDLGTANASTVLFVPASGGNPDLVTVSVGGRSVSFVQGFGTGAATVTPTFTDGSQLFIGGAGNDTAALGAGNDAMFGGAGADILNAGGGNNVLQGNQGDDVLVGGAGSDTIYGGADNDQITLVGSGQTSSTITNFGQGNKGADTINGGVTDADTILGGQGSDLIGAATFSVSGSPGGAYSAQATGLSGGGNDFLNGNLGDDTIVGGAGNDTIFGEDGNDLIVDGGGTIFANIPGGGHDTIDAGAGNDTVVASGGSDIILFGDGDDLGGILGGGAATDSAFLDGGAGNDNLSGGAGRDQILGGTGNDTIDGWDGADTVSGGPGADLFQYYSGSDTRLGAGQQEVITDWSGVEDQLYFANGDTDADAGAGTAGNYLETTAATYDAALALANAQIAAGTINYVAVQVGADVFVFADSAGNNGTADQAVQLLGKTLADIAFTNFVAS